MEALFFRDISLMLNALGAGNCFLLAYTFIKSDNKRVRVPQPLLALLFFILGTTIANTIFNVAGYSQLIPAFEPLNNALGFTIGPLLYLQISNCRPAIKRAGLGSPHLWWPYFYFVISVWGSLFAHRSDGAFFELIISHPAIQIVWNLYIFIYLILAYGSLRKAEGKVLRWLVVLFWSIVGIWSINLLLKMARFFVELSPIWYLNITLLFTIVACWLSVKRIRMGLARPRKNAKGRISSTSEIPPTMEDQILMLIKEKKYYRDPHLTIRDLSDYLGLAYPQLSQFINTAYERNFNAFINKFRIEEVTRELTNNKHQAYTIMGLAQKSGFNSASSFYAAFKKETGKTPKAYLRDKTL